MTTTPWTLDKIDGAAVEQVGKIEFAPKSEGAKDGLYTATFKGAKEGKATILLKGLVEAGKKDMKEMKFTVTVSAAGN